MAIVELPAADSPRDFEVLQCVGVICLNFGNLVRELEGPSASLPLDRRSVQAFDEAHRVSPDHAEMIRLLKGARGNLRMTYEMLGRHDDALAQVEASLPLCSPAERSGLRVAKGLILARTGRHEQAAFEARSLGAEDGLDAETLYNLACVDSLAVAAVRADPKVEPAKKSEIAAAYAVEASRLLERSSRAGQMSAKDLLGLLAKDPDLEPIRSTSEFQAVLTRLSVPAGESPRATLPTHRAGPRHSGQGPGR